MTTLLDVIRSQAEKIARERYGKSYQELIPIRQTEVWFEAQLAVEERQESRR